jgi:hypothetical protein
LPLKCLSRPAEVLHALFFFKSWRHVIAVTAYFCFPWLVTPFVFCQARSNLASQFSSNQKINAETPSTSEDGRTRRSGYFVVRATKSPSSRLRN